MKDETEILWRMCNEHYTQCRQHETLRSQSATFSSAITAAAVAFIAQGGITRADLPLTLLLIGIGCFGALLSAKHYERFKYHTERARGHRLLIEQMLPGAELARIRKDADAIHNALYPRLHKLRQHHLWMGLQLIIVLLGAILTGLVIFAR